MKLKPPLKDQTATKDIAQHVNYVKKKVYVPDFGVAKNPFIYGEADKKCRFN